jgi:hypothetical protein
MLIFFSSRGWESWDVEHRPLIPEGMPVLVDDDLRFEDGPGATRPAAVVNRWLRELPASGAVECGAREFVHFKDFRIDLAPVVIAMAVTRDGIPCAAGPSPIAARKVGHRPASDA